MTHQNPTLKVQKRMFNYLKECDEQCLLTTPSEIKQVVGGTLSSVKTGLEFFERLNVVDIRRSSKGTWLVSLKRELSDKLKEEDIEQINMGVKYVE